MRVCIVNGLIGALLWVVAVGCGKQGETLPVLVPVGGKVTLDGKPLSGATVTFMPTGSTRGPNCYGYTDKDGRYELKVDEKHKGAPAGEFNVLCSKWVMPDGSDVSREIKVPPWEAGAKELLPPHYTTDGMSHLRATVPADGGTADFALKTGRP